jgi:Flp pilus assembly protein TadG
MSGCVRPRCGQSLVEFALTIGALMVLVVGVAQIAIYLHYRTSLSLACREGAFQAGLAGHSLADGQQATVDLWQKLEPQARAISTTATQQQALVVVSAHGWAPAIVPVPVPPFTRIPIAAQCVHTAERFEPGSSP